MGLEFGPRAPEPGLEPIPSLLDQAPLPRESWRHGDMAGVGSQL